jgi:hypothetical protein
VTGADGLPAAKARVWVALRREDQGAHFTSTDAEGRFEVARLAPGRRYVVRIHRDVAIDDVAVGTTGLHLVMPAR